MKWSIPEKVIERGRTYVNEGRVLSVEADTTKNIWYADVLGSKTYHVILDGTSKEEDICSCPYWLEHHYCKHTIAVELYLRKKGLNRIIAQNPTMLLPQVKKKVAMSEIFTRGFEKIPTISTHFEYLRPLQVEFVVTTIETNKYHLELSVLGISLKIGYLATQKMYIVKNIGDFFSMLEREDTLSVNKNNQFQLLHENFDEETLALLNELFSIYKTSQLFGNVGVNVNGKMDKRYLVLPVENRRELMERLSQSGAFTLELGDETYTSVQFIEGSLPLHFIVKKQGEDVLLKIEDTLTAYFENYGWAFWDNRIYEFSPIQLSIYSTMKQLLKRVEIPEILYEKENISDLFSTVLPLLEQIGTVDVEEKVSEEIVYANLKTSLYLKKRRGNIDVRLDFQYGDVVFSTDNSFSHVGEQTKQVIRQKEKEEAIFKKLEEFHYRKTDTGFEKTLPSGEGLYYFFQGELPELRKLGEVFLGKKLSGLMLDAQKYRPMIEVNDTGSWLDVRFDITGIDQTEIDSVLTSLLRNDAYYTLKSGEILSFDSEEFHQTSEILKKLRQNLRSHEGVFSLPRSQGMLIADTLKDSKRAHFTSNFKEMVEDLNHPEKFDVALPKNLHAELRHYQVDGFKWLKMLSHYSFGGILADEMGLGKTLQTITYLLSEKETAWQGQTLIVAPASLTYNWLAEFKKFAPSLNIKVISGNKAERTEMIEHSQDIDVLVTSYASLRQDIDLYNRLTLGYLILDEAQMVKNASTKTSQALRGLQVAQRFALSGTPIENNIDELWSIFQMVLPGFFPSRQKFRELSTSEVARMVQPFILRRDKKSVLHDLPEKIEMNLYSSLTEEQKTVYLAYLKQMQSEITGMDAATFKKNRLSILAGLTRLRQICDDPHLFLEDYEGSSGKLEQAKDILQAAKENNRRILLFSQFTSMLTILERELNGLGLETFYLRGSTKPKDRIDMVNAFNSGKRDVFLISLKAGGTGLNLTGADTVILYDLWWNPAVEEQAAGRAHRIGQENVVEVWRMIAEGTIEERMNQLQQEKRELFQKVITGNDEQVAQLSEDDIRLILSIGEEDL
ncbi:MAG: DEAD/DEAH box helicase [Lactobacillales bacterium]|jgi:superfamily II DNA or RNA helicase|nr:DEAD/DEAH box helicase [Lactobacillales bacterium]